MNGFAVARFYLEFLNDPLLAVEKLVSTHGRFVQLPHPRPPLHPRRTFLVAVGPVFNRDVLGNPNVWRTVSVGPGGPNGTAARRLQYGIVRMTGPRHEHYRRILVPALQRKSIDALGAKVVRLADESLDTWPTDHAIDLRAHVKRLMRTFAIGLLFGDDRAHGYPIAEMIDSGIDFNWSWRIAACPVNIPGTPYNRALRDGEVLERRILDWAVRKRGKTDKHDLLSLVINSPDENGHPASDERVVGHMPTLFGAAYETCQNSLIWTLILLDQHPNVARDLYAEIQCTGGPRTYDQIMALPLLDAVIKESMRILPPVPQQFRVATQDTSLNGVPVSARTRVLLSAFLTNRERGLYAEPDRFKPERWAKIAPSSYEYSGFSAGPRGCPGYSFGIAILKVAVARIFQRFHVGLAADARIDYQVRVALSPRTAVPAFLHRCGKTFSSSPIRGRIRHLVRFPN